MIIVFMSGNMLLDTLACYGEFRPMGYQIMFHSVSLGLDLFGFNVAFNRYVYVGYIKDGGI